MVLYATPVPSQSIDTLQPWASAPILCKRISRRPVFSACIGRISSKPIAFRHSVVPIICDSTVKSQWYCWLKICIVFCLFFPNLYSFNIFGFSVGDFLFFHLCIYKIRSFYFIVCSSSVRFSGVSMSHSSRLSATGRVRTLSPWPAATMPPPLPWGRCFNSSK